MRLTSPWIDPNALLANASHEFEEYNGVNMSIEVSATFTMMELETMKPMFTDELGPDHILCFALVMKS